MEGANELAEFTWGRVIEWYEREGRKHFFWRGRTDPYTILIAEILLKKTRAETAAPHIVRFLNKYPSVEDLARAPLRDVEEVLRPLGLYRQRAAHIKRLAEELVAKHSGKISDSYEELITLPGVGEYTANAVLCFAYGKNAPLVDTNTARIITRFFGVVPSASEARRSPEIWCIARGLASISSCNVREFWWGMIDLAALICTPRRPSCWLCPLHGRCRYYASSKR